MLAGTRARGEPREVVWLLDVEKRDVEKRGGRGTELSTRIDSAGEVGRWNSDRIYGAGRQRLENDRSRQQEKDEGKWKWE
jgi:hypothetical protein